MRGKTSGKHLEDHERGTQSCQNLDQGESSSGYMTIEVLMKELALEMAPPCSCQLIAGWLELGGPHSRRKK